MEALQEKRVDAQTVVCIRHTGSHDDIGSVYHELRKWTREHNIPVVGRGITVFLRTPQQSDFRSGLFEVCLPVSGQVPADDRVTVKKTPACTVAYTVVKGPYNEIPARYSEILAWLSAQGREAIAPPREVYLEHPDAQGEGDANEFVTEIQFPIQQ